MSAEVMTRWARSVELAAESIERGEDRERDGAVEVSSSTPTALTNLGIEDLPVYMHAAHILKALRPEVTGHGIDAGDLRDLPDLLGEPALIMKQRKGRLGVILCRHDRKDRPLVAIVAPQAHVKGSSDREDVYCNLVVSLFGRSAVSDWVERAHACGDVIWLDPDRMRRAFQVACQPIPAALLKETGRGSCLTDVWPKSKQSREGGPMPEEGNMRTARNTEPLREIAYELAAEARSSENPRALIELSLRVLDIASEIDGAFRKIGDEGDAAA